MSSGVPQELSLSQDCLQHLKLKLNVGEFSSNKTGIFPAFSTGKIYNDKKKLWKRKKVVCFQQYAKIDLKSTFVNTYDIINMNWFLVFMVLQHGPS